MTRLIAPLPSTCTPPPTGDGLDPLADLGLVEELLDLMPVEPTTSGRLRQLRALTAVQRSAREAQERIRAHLEATCPAGSRTQTPEARLIAELAAEAAPWSLPLHAQKRTIAPMSASLERSRERHGPP